MIGSYQLKELWVAGRQCYCQGEATSGKVGFSVAVHKGEPEYGELEVYYYSYFFVGEFKGVNRMSEL